MLRIQQILFGSGSSGLSIIHQQCLGHHYGGDLQRHHSTGKRSTGRKSYSVHAWAKYWYISSLNTKYFSGMFELYYYLLLFIFDDQLSPSPIEAEWCMYGSVELVTVVSGSGVYPVKPYVFINEQVISSEYCRSWCYGRNVFRKKKWPYSHHIYVPIVCINCVTRQSQHKDAFRRSLTYSCYHMYVSWNLD